MCNTTEAVATPPEAAAGAADFFVRTHAVQRGLRCEVLGGSFLCDGRTNT